MSDLIELLPMTRRSFMGSILALAAAPAIVRASSLMPVQAPFDWTKYVREVVQYHINDDSYRARWDIMAPGWGQFHVDTELWPAHNLPHWQGQVDKPTRDNLLTHQRRVALQVLEDRMRHENIAPRRLVRPPLPKGIDWARHLDG
jgi:hypothetical protein